MFGMGFGSVIAKIFGSSCPSGGWLAIPNCPIVFAIPGTSISLIIYLCIFFLIGLFIGWIVGKVKARKQIILNNNL
jgi:hypothetical protein